MKKLYCSQKANMSNLFIFAQITTSYIYQRDSYKILYFF